MTVLDEDGRLFGVLNVVDALVVLLVLAAALAGVAVLDPFAAEPTPAGSAAANATRYATVDLDGQSGAVAGAISAGDNATLDGGDRIDVTDVYVGPGEGPNATVLVRARLDGQLRERPETNGTAFVLNGTPIEEGGRIVLDTAEYRVDGEVLAIGTEDAALDTGTLPVVFDASVSASVAAAIEVGDTDRVAGRPVASVETVEVVPGPTGDNRTALLGVALRTINRSGTITYGSEEVRLGSSIEFDTDSYTLSGTVVRRGNATPAGEPTNATIAVNVSNASPATADAIQTGAVERSGNVTTARIVEKRVAPATVVLTSEGGEIYAREHPRKKDVSLTVAVRARRTDDGLRFHARPLRAGSPVTLALGNVTVNGTVVEVGA
jgi:hypothetical protein